MLSSQPILVIEPACLFFWKLNEAKVVTVFELVYYSIIVADIDVNITHSVQYDLNQYVLSSIPYI